MRLALALLTAGSLLFAADAGKTPAKPVAAAKTAVKAAPKADISVPPGVEVDEQTLEVLRRINSVGPYEVPNVRLMREQNYARTSVDVEPFGGVKPYKEHFLLQMEYTGPGRALPEPEKLDSVKIGFIGPIMSTVSVATGGKSHEEALGIKMLQGARLALEETNAKGGYLRRKIPFELVVANDNGLWGSTGNEVTKMVYSQGIWAILGTIDSANSHIAIRVALKAETVMMNTGDTDPTFIETNIPWTMRNIGDDRQMGYLMVDYMIRKMGYKRIAIIRSSNRYGRFGVREIKDSSRRMGKPVVIEMAYKVGIDDFSLQLERVKAVNPDVVVHWGDARESALILNQMRKMGLNQPYMTSDRSVSDEFVKLAGENAKGVIGGFPWNPDRKDPKYDEFKKNFRARFNEEPDTYAAHAYDGMNMLIWGFQVAGLNKAKMRDILATRSKPWPGVTGDIPFSAVLDDAGEVFLAKYEGGRWNYYSREQLQVPKGFVPSRERVSRGLETSSLK
jgi:ABC-type branched-subunit amino acid transport system substrate-binding protein